MQTSVISGLTASLLFGLSAAATQDPPLPSEDPFYSQPANISLYKPGEVIAHREVPNALNGFLGSQPVVSVNSSHQYLYRTTDSLGDPVAGVMTLLVPNNADPTKLLAYQTAYDSSNNDCAPSYSLRSGANNTATSDIVFMAAALNNGWYITTADHEGLHAQFVAGVQAGQATLDSVRAALVEAPKYGLDADAKYALWGYSGGALASEWAAELQPTYAPELHFEGAALGGLTPNITNVILSIDKNFFAGLAFAGTHGLAAAYPNLTQYLNENLVPSKVAEYNSIGNGCLGGDTTGGAFQDVFSYIKEGKAALLDPVPKSILETVQAGNHGTPTMPLYVYKANGDEISPAADTDDLVAKFCDEGATVLYRKDLLGEHVSEAIFGSIGAFTWIGERLAGKPLNQTGCITEVVALSSIDPDEAAPLGEELIALLETAVLGGDLGRQFSISG